MLRLATWTVKALEPLGRRCCTVAWLALAIPGLCRPAVHLVCSGVASTVGDFSAMIRTEALAMGAAGIASALPFAGLCVVARKLPLRRRPRNEPVGAAVFVMLILALIIQVGVWSCGPCGLRGGCSTAVIGLFTFPCISVPLGAFAYYLVDQITRGDHAPPSADSPGPL